MDLISIATIGLALIFLSVPIATTLRFYLKTRIKEFGFLFLSLVSLYFIGITVLFNGPGIRDVYDGEIPIQSYITLYRITYLLTVSSSFGIFWIAYLMKDGKDKVLTGIVVSLYISICVLVFLTDFGEIPEQANFFGLNLVSIVGGEGSGMIYQTEWIVFGTGYDPILHVYNVIVNSYFIGSLFSIKNTLNYKNFQRVKLIWITIAVGFIALAIWSLTFTFFPSLGEWAPSTARIVASLSLISLALMFLSIFFPEGIVLSKAQVARLYQLNSQDGLNGISHNRFNPLTKKMLEYIDFIEENAKSTNEIGNVD